MWCVADWSWYWPLGCCRRRPGPSSRPGYQPVAARYRRVFFPSGNRARFGGRQFQQLAGYRRLSRRSSRGVSAKRHSHLGRQPRLGALTDQISNGDHGAPARAALAFVGPVCRPALAAHRSRGRRTARRTDPRAGHRHHARAQPRPPAKFYEIPQAKADTLQASLRANPVFYQDGQLLAYPGYHFSRQVPGGPSQYDTNITFLLDVTRQRQARTAVAERPRRSWRRSTRRRSGSGSTISTTLT